MHKLAPLALLFSAGLLVAGCNSDSTEATVKPTPKNVLFFLGDGMGITTLTASRIYAYGEDGNLTIDTLPETAFLKTYSNDSQVTDSAPRPRSRLRLVPDDASAASTTPAPGPVPASGVDTGTGTTLPRG